MESVGALMSQEHEIGLDKARCAGNRKSFCNTVEWIVKDCYCSFYSPGLEYNCGSALLAILIR